MTGSKERVDLTVIIPVRNESLFITQTLKQLVGQETGAFRFEFIVVDGESEDGTPELVRAFSERNPDHDISLMSNPKRLSSAARNIGLKNARGRFVQIVDGHVYMPTARVLRRSLELANEHNAQVLGRPQRLTPPGLTQTQALIAAVRASKIGHSGESHIFGGSEGFVSPISVAVMYETKLALELGGFDESFDAAEDLEFNYRLEKAGLRCLISPELEVFYYPRTSLAGLFRQMRRYGLGRARFLRKHPERFTPETAVPPGFTAGMSALLIFGAFAPMFLFLFITLLAGYAGVVLAVNHRLLNSHGVAGLMAVPIALAVHMGLGFGFLEGTIRSGATR